MKIARDTNGNKTLKAESKDLQSRRHNTSKPRGFSVQTVKNLPETHRHGIHYATKGELFEHIKEHGTPNQKSLLSVGEQYTLNDADQEHHEDTGKPVFRALTSQDLDELTELLGGRKKADLRVALKYWRKKLATSTKERIVHNTDGGWQYIAGQDYPSELARIRKELLK